MNGILVMVQKSKVKKAEAEHLFASTGQYIIQLNVVDTLTGEILLNEDTYPFDVMDIEQAYISSPDTVVAELSVKFDASATNLPEFKKIEYYYWDFGDGEREVGLSPEHNFLVPGNYNVRLCVQSSADEMVVLSNRV
ncbi:MAG: PKD domain-containing protein [Bacteroidales bacterium]|nr:PKD domain-containing protein [Bacteroidales bacterium]